MSNIRILHCGKSIENYNICIDKKVLGYMQKINSDREGDIVYLVVKVGNESLCGARVVVGEATEEKPWKDGERYVQCSKIKELEYCKPFSVNILRKTGIKNWVLRYIQGAKAITDEIAINLLEEEFNKNKTNEFFVFEENNKTNKEFKKNKNIEINNEYNKSINKKIKELDIVDTFKTIKFKNETDPIQGLEPLVTKHFYDLFDVFEEKNSILISDNRLFSTVGIKNSKNENIIGIKGIPDALLITYDKKNKKTPLKINLIEYECYGESKSRTSQKLNYLNGVIVPQLIRFASTFSIVTDYKIREKTINEWIEKIISHIDSDDELMEKVDIWIKDINPNIKDREINSTLKTELKKSFETNLKIILIIDELTLEQKEIIANVINSFKLNNSIIKEKDNYIDFSAYTVRLEVKTNSKENNIFALSYQ